MFVALDPMILICIRDLDILKMYPYTKNELCKTDRQTDAQTDLTEEITTIHLWIVIIIA